MILDIKYHIFTITAIFAALGLGILIGSSLIGHEGLVGEQKKIIENIGRDIYQLKMENASLKDRTSDLQQELEYRKKSEKKILSLMLKKFIKDKKFVLYADNDSQLKEIKGIFATAGASVKTLKSEKKLEDMEDFYRLILWNTDIKTTLPQRFKDKAIVCRNSDIFQLMQLILESEADE